MASSGNNFNTPMNSPSPRSAANLKSALGDRFNALLVGRTPAPRSERSGRPPGDALFDWVAVSLSALIVGGLFLDGWAHNHGKVDQSFFTLWHALLYSAFAIYAVFLLVNVIRHYREGYGWRQALPYGYGLPLVGAGIFAAGGVLDLIWHTLFGIEADVQALVSPTHLILATGLFFMLTGPLRSIWRRLGERTLTWATGTPLILALALILSVLMFFTQYANPFVTPWAANDPRTQVVHGDLYVMRADGTGQTRLTSAQQDGGLPSWSPDGVHIAFAAGDPGSMGIYVVQSNGTGLKRLTARTTDSSQPAWSPDGRHIAFVVIHNGSSQIMLMNADGSKPRQLTSGSANSFGPAWSPDGKRVIFESNQSGDFNLYTTNVSGKSQLVRLTKTSGADDFQPAWSRDGKHIAFVSTRTGKAQVYVMSADGSSQRRLSAGFSPVWSPDDTRIAFVTARDGNDEIYVMHADGSHQVNLSNDAGVDDGAGLVAWSPDGRAIAYGSVGHSTIDPETSTALGIAGILLQAALLIGVLLLALQRWALPPGAATLIFTVSAVLISFMHDEFRFIPVAVLAGVVADVLIFLLRPSPGRVRQLRIFAFAVPAVYFLLYFVAVALTSGVSWVIHLWFGAPIMAGILGLFLSYLVVPPKLQTGQTAWGR